MKEKKPLSTARHRNCRLDYAIAHQDWTVNDQKRLTWSGKTNIDRLRPDGRNWTWQWPGEGPTDRPVQGTQKCRGGSVIVSGCMPWDGIGDGCRMNERMIRSRSWRVS